MNYVKAIIFIALILGAFPLGSFGQSCGNLVINPITGLLDCAGSAGGGSGTVQNITGSNGVGTSTGAAVTVTGTFWADWPRNAQTGTTYALVTGDRGKVVTFSNAASIAVSINQAGTTGFEAGWLTVVKNIGAGTATITPGGGSLVDGAATITLLTGDWALLSSNGTDYETVNNKVASGTNLTVTPARTGKSLAVTAAGSSNDIQVNNSGSLAGGRCTMDSSQNLTCTGTVAAPVVSATGTTAGEVSTYELALNGSEYISWLAPDSITTTYRLMFPTAVPSAGQVLTFSAPSGGIATGTWSTPSSTISTPFFLPFGPMAVGGGTLTATIGSANRVYHIAANAPAALSVSNVNLGTSNFGNLAVAFYDSSCTLIGQTATTATSATGVTVAVNSAPITIPAGKFYVSWTGDATASAIYGTSAGYVPDMWNAGATPEYFYGSNASTGTTTLTFPGTCGTRTAVANGANPQPPGIILR